MAKGAAPLGPRPDSATAFQSVHAPAPPAPGDDTIRHAMSDSVELLPVPVDPDKALIAPVLDWYAGNARDLPWRRPDAGPWAVLVSEFMLQQTPVTRVLSVYETWMARWPTPAALAAEPSGEAIRAWGRLGYPRRALRLHAAAERIVSDYDGQVPSGYEDLRGLPGVGDYTAAAVGSFAFGGRHLVLDTNTRRVVIRAVAGSESPPRGAATAAERRLAEAIVPTDPARASAWAVASMELGALVCISLAPRCMTCPVRRTCAWQRGGRPSVGPVRRRQPYAGTDRQARGALLGVVRDGGGNVTTAELAAAWPQLPEQRARALAGLVADGLVERLPTGSYGLPGSSQQRSQPASLPSRGGAQ
jgi:A/G-specific adenine glycosylase